MFTTGGQTYVEPQVGWWQIFCRLIAANKYLALQLISPTTDLQVKTFEYDRIFFGEKRFPCNFFTSHLSCAISILYYSLKIRSLLSYPRQNVQTRHGLFPQQRIFTNGKYLQKDRIPHVSVDWKIDLQVKERGLNFEERSGCGFLAGMPRDSCGAASKIVKSLCKCSSNSRI